jgi:hypothetical protein
MKSTVAFLLTLLILNACNDQKTIVETDLSDYAGSYEVISFFDAFAGQNRAPQNIFYSIYKDGNLSAFERIEADSEEPPRFAKILAGQIREAEDGTYAVTQFGRTYQMQLVKTADGLEIRYPYAIAGASYTDVMTLRRIGYDPANHLDGIEIEVAKRQPRSMVFGRIE